MISRLAAVTGIGSVSPYGHLTGPITPRDIEPRPITAWPVTATRRAFLAEPFHSPGVAPGLRTRRLDRLSVWSLVAASLAIRDSGLDPESIDASRAAIVAGTGFGCIELTEAFYRSAAVHGWHQTDPILFPETLGNSPGGHIARHLQFRGPNVTVGSTGVAGESALLQGASLLRNGQADLVIVVTGDTITRATYEWFETSGRLSAACFDNEPVANRPGFVPAEGVVAVLLEPVESRAFRSYATVVTGHQATCASAESVIGKTLSKVEGERKIFCAARGAVAEAAARKVEDGRIEMATPDPVAEGIGDTGGLFRLATAVAEVPHNSPLLMLGSSARASFAALLLEVS